jgi:pancreatic triacylglycerol lipase
MDNNLFIQISTQWLTLTIFYRQGKNIYIINTNFHCNFVIFNRIIIHGYLQSGSSNMNRLLKNAYITRGEYNVIVVDWSSVSPLSTWYYSGAIERVLPTGIAVSRMIQWLKIDLTRLHIVGFDLGAHIAGVAGKNLNGLVVRIVGLDPNRSGFSSTYLANKLTQTDAVLVEIYHSSDQTGFYAPYGDLDFYINNGRFQIGCANNYCSHYQSVVVYSKILNGQNNYIVVPCADIAEVAVGCSLDPIDIAIDEAAQTGIYQIRTSNVAAINTEVETLS